MKKEKTLHTLWFLLAIAVAIGVATFVYASTGLGRCYWSRPADDLCYAVGALRINGGLRSGFVEHTALGEGLSPLLFLSWAYALASKAGFLEFASFQSLATHEDPLLLLRQFVIAGWVSGGAIFLLIVATVFGFARFLTGSDVISFFASMMAAVSWSNLQFLMKIRSEAFGACLGVLSLYLVFKALRASRLSGLGLYLATGGMALAYSLFAKRNALPYLALLPLVFLLETETPWDRARAGARGLALKYAFVANSFLFAPLVLLMRYWPEFIALFNLSLVPVLAAEILGFVLLLLLYVFLVFVVRLCRSYGRASMRELFTHAAVDAAAYVLVLMIGFELAIYSSFVQPRFNAYSLFLLLVFIAGCALAVVAGRRGQVSMAALLRAPLVQRLVSANAGIIILAAVAWGALWQLARVFPEAFGAHIEVAVSRSLFEIMHPQSSFSLLSSADHASTFAYFRSVGAEVWGYYRRSRWLELVIVALTLLELLRARKIATVRVVVFFTLAGMGLLFFSSLRHLYPSYLLYADLITILTVSLCISSMVNLQKERIHGGRATFHTAIVVGIVVCVGAFAVVRRSQELRGMQIGTLSSGCNSPPRGSDCLCDYYYAGTKHGGTGLKEIIEQQYEAECMQAVEARAVRGLP